MGLDTMNITILVFYMSFTKPLTIMHFHASLSRHVWIISFPLILLSVHSLMLLKYIFLCLPFTHLPYIFPVSNKFSIPFLYITYPKNVVFLFLIVCSNSSFYTSYYYYSLICYFISPQNLSHFSLKPYFCCLQAFFS